MKKQLTYLIVLVLLSSTQVYGQQAAALRALHARNNATSQANQAAYAAQPNHFTLALMQPTDGYLTLNSCVNYLFSRNRMPAGYGKIPDQNWHISTLVLAVPFVGQPNAREVQNAMSDLRRIVKKYKNRLQGVAYKFDKLESIGTNKFLAAQYSFQTGRRRFLEAYANIIRDFLRLHPNAWLFYGYRTLPHISVASTANPAGQVTVSTGRCRPISDIILFHAGRDMFVSGGFFGPRGRLQRFQSRPI